MLNFAGMRSGSYITGCILADLVIFLIPSVIFIGLVWLLNIEVFQGSIGNLFTIFFMFGFAYVNIINLLGFWMKDVINAYKNIAIWMYLLALIVPIAVTIGAALIGGN